MQKDTIRVCPSCRKELAAEDRYCRYCGADCRMAEPYVPGPEGEDFSIPGPVVYGPAPVRRIHKCTNKKCEFVWCTFDMIDDEKFCPRCGQKALMRDF